MVAGDAARLLEVIDSVTESQQAEIAQFLLNTPITVECVEDGLTLDIRITGWRGEESALIRIAGAHTNIVRLEKNGEVIREEPAIFAAYTGDAPSILNTADIVAFADLADLNRLNALLRRQLSYNLSVFYTVLQVQRQRRFYCIDLIY